jgi:hypothetical protein
MQPLTYAQTFTYTRVGAIADQMQYLLRIGGATVTDIERIVEGVKKRPPDIEAVGVYCVDRGNERVLEIELAVDWAAHARFVLSDPYLSGSDPGWDRDGDLNVAPETYVAGDKLRTFLKSAASVGESIHPRHWVLFTQRVREDSALHSRLCADHGLALGGALPRWRGGIPPEEHTRRYGDLPEAALTNRRAVRRA